jgi:hypothetical protein
MKSLMDLPPCHECRYYRKTDDKQGECHRYPPQVVLMPVRLSALSDQTGLAPVGLFPAVKRDASCGEYDPMVKIIGGADSSSPDGGLHGSLGGELLLP